MPWRPAAAHLALMRSLHVVMGQPIIQIQLQFVKTFIKFPTEGYLIEFLQDGFMEAFTNAVGLGMPRFCLGVLYAIDTQIEFIIVRFDLAAELCSPVCQDADEPHALFLKERQHTVIEQVC